MNITTDVAPSFTAGQTQCSNAKGTQLTTGKATRGIHIKAAPTNTGTIYVGGPDVTTATGFPLQAGQEVTIPVQDITGVYGIASVNNEVLAWLWA